MEKNSEMMTTPTKGAKPLAFDIDIKENININNESPAGKSAQKIKEKLEQRKMELENSEEKLSLDQINEKLDKANEKKQKTFEEKTK